MSRGSQKRKRAKRNVSTSPQADAPEPKKKNSLLQRYSPNKVIDNIVENLELHRRKMPVAASGMKRSGSVAAAVDAIEKASESGPTPAAENADPLAASAAGGREKTGEEVIVEVHSHPEGGGEKEKGVEEVGSGGMQQQKGQEGSQVVVGNSSEVLMLNDDGSGVFSSNWADEDGSDRDPLEGDTLQKLKTIQEKLQAGGSIMAEEVLKGMFDTFVDIVTKENKKCSLLEEEVRLLRQEVKEERKRADALASQVCGLKNEWSKERDAMKLMVEEVEEMKEKMKDLEIDKKRRDIKEADSQLIAKRVPGTMSTEEVRKLMMQELKMSPDVMPRIVRLRSSPIMEERMKEKNYVVGSPCLLQFRDENDKHVFLGSLRHLTTNDKCKKFIFDQSIHQSLRDECRPLAQKAYDLRAKHGSGTRTLIRFTHEGKPYLVMKRRGEAKFAKV